MNSNIELIKNKINTITESDKFIKKAKIQRLQFYKDNLTKVNQMQVDKIVDYNFKNEVINHAYNLRKSSLTPKILKQIIKLELHAYAPEINKLHFTKNRIVKIPQITTIENALTFLINTMNFEQLTELTK
jgi:hypothetical protein